MIDSSRAFAGSVFSSMTSPRGDAEELHDISYRRRQRRTRKHRGDEGVLDRPWCERCQPPHEELQIRVEHETGLGSQRLAEIERVGDEIPELSDRRRAEGDDVLDRLLHLDG